MTALSIDLQRTTSADRAKTPVPKQGAGSVSKGRNSKVGVMRSLQKMSDDSKAELLSGKAAHAAFGHLRRV